MTTNYNKTLERIKWWLYHPHYELIYLLGGVPKQHINTMHYRNIESIVSNLQEQIKKSNV